jgi:hypothetical protein
MTLISKLFLLKHTQTLSIYNLSKPLFIYLHEKMKIVNTGFILSIHDVFPSIHYTKWIKDNHICHSTKMIVISIQLKHHAS